MITLHLFLYEVTRTDIFGDTAMVTCLSSPVQQCEEAGPSEEPELIWRGSVPYDRAPGAIRPLALLQVRVQQQGTILEAEQPSPGTDPART